MKTVYELLKLIHIKWKSLAIGCVEDSAWQSGVSGLERLRGSLLLQTGLLRRITGWKSVLCHMHCPILKVESYPCDFRKAAANKKSEMAMHYMNQLKETRGKECMI